MQGQYFDAMQFDPTQGGGLPKHPIGKFPAGVTATDIKPNKENDGQYLEIVYTTQAGQIAQRFNLWNNSAMAVDIAQRQLSALCHATGIYKLDMAKKGAELLNAGLQIEVREQLKNPAYNEVFKVFDKNGVEPGQAGTQQQTTQQQPQPTGQTWNQQPKQEAQPQPQPNGGSPWQPGAAATGGATVEKAPWQK